MNFDIKNFLLFVGSGRSGSTVIASLLNSHPNVLISSELGIIKLKVESPERAKNLIYKHTLKKKLVYKSINKNIDNKSLNIKKETINVIGDKHSDQNTLNIHKNPELFDIFKESTYNLKLLHVIRNPYDVITTKYLRKRKKFNGGINEFTKKGFGGAINEYHNEIKTVEMLRKDNDILDIRLEDTIYYPKKNISNMFDFFNLDYNNEMVNSISKLLIKEPSVSRYKVNGTDDQITKVKKLIGDYSCLNGYKY